MESTQKHFLIDNFLTSLVCKDRQKTVRNNQCMTCSGDADTFTDELSVKEYRISGMCQSCQDKVFVDLQKDVKTSSGMVLWKTVSGICFIFI